MKKTIAILLAAAMLLCVLAGCGKTKEEEAAPAAGITVSGDTIKIGVFEPTTGENGGGGMQEVLGVRYANSVKPTATVNGKEYKIELVEVDNQSDKTAAVTAASSLISSGVVTVLGSYGSGVSIAAGETFANAQVPAVGLSCTNPQVTAENDFYFRVCFLDPFQGTVMANFAYETMGCKSAFVISQNGDDYSTGLANYFKQAYKGELVGEAAYQTNESDFNAFINQAIAANPEVVFIPSSIQTAGLFIKQAREAGLTCPIMAGDTWENATIIENAGAENVDGVYFSTFFDENDSAAADFVAGFKAYLNSDADLLVKNGNTDSVAAVSALGYDGYMTAITAIESLTGEVNSVAIRDALKTTTYAGVTGAVSFNEVGDANKDMAYIKAMNANGFEFLGTQKTDGSFQAVK